VMARNFFHWPLSGLSCACRDRKPGPQQAREKNSARKKFIAKKSACAIRPRPSLAGGGQSRQPTMFAPRGAFWRRRPPGDPLADRKALAPEQLAHPVGEHGLAGNGRADHSDLKDGFAILAPLVEPPPRRRVELLLEVGQERPQVSDHGGVLHVEPQGRRAE